MVRQDVLIAGAGPSGLAIGAALARCGRHVLVVAPAPEATWNRSFGTWEVGVVGQGLDAAVTHRAQRAVVELDGKRRFELDAPYLRFDTPRLQRLLLDRARDAGVTIHEGKVESVRLEPKSGASIAEVVQGGESGERRFALAARLVIDARGAEAPALEPNAPTRPQTSPGGYQTAFGLLLEVEHHPYGLDEIGLMDFRTDGAGASGPVTFLYAVPYGTHRLFAQETVLAARAVVPMAHLEARLRARLARLGIRIRRELEVEHCVIPMGGALPPESSDILPYGARAGFVHPATGYQLARALGLADGTAAVISAALENESATSRQVATLALSSLWPPARRSAFGLYGFGLECIVGFDKARTDDFFDAFFRMPTERWLGFMEGTLAPDDVGRAMWSLFTRASNPLKFELVRRGLGAPRLLSQALS